MTRGFVFTLIDPTLFYNLWDDLIAKSPGFDKTMSNGPYIPNMVSELQIYFPVAGPNSVNNAGNNFSLVDKVTGSEMSNQISDGLFKISLSRNYIPLNNFKIQGSAANVQIEVTIASV